MWAETTGSFLEGSGRTKPPKKRIKNHWIGAESNRNDKTEGSVWRRIIQAEGMKFNKTDNIKC